MKIDTSYNKSGDALVDIVLETTEERTLTDEQLARIGCNQDRLSWLDDDSGSVELPPEDPRFFPLPPDSASYTVSRDADRVRVSYGRKQEDTKGALMLALAASLAVAFGTISTLRYNDTFQHTLPLNYPSAYT